ncbi:hypothetical protein DFH06DRAFT_987198 [Mycena polygramma]|nr:hypothetical protein DFH06DRAFT_987198 [Mycena polygramma]
MEAYFDNKTNITNARIRTVRDDAPMYAVLASFAFQGRVRTVMRDENPLPSTSYPSSTSPSTGTDAGAVIVGAINWKERSFEVRGQRWKYEEVRRKEGGVVSQALLIVCGVDRTRFWRWGKERKEYELLYTHEEWKTPSIIAARFTVPARPHLFSKSPPAVVYLTPDALAEDEVFLLLVFIYEEVKRQERTVSLSAFVCCFWDLGGLFSSELPSFLFRSFCVIWRPAGCMRCFTPPAPFPALTLPPPFTFYLPPSSCYLFFFLFNYSPRILGLIAAFVLRCTEHLDTRRDGRVVIPLPFPLPFLLAPLSTILNSAL